MTQLTKPQQKAVVALVLLRRDSPAAGFSRWAIGRVSKEDYSSYPMRTMRVLQRRGLACPVSDEAVALVEQELCRCGCDLWYATAKGHEYVATLNVTFPSRKRK